LFASETWGESKLIAVVTALHDRLGEAGRKDGQDAVADVLDSLAGFCSPSAKLWVL
jgi:hypothetical protein